MNNYQQNCTEDYLDQENGIDPTLSEQPTHEGDIQLTECYGCPESEYMSENHEFMDAEYMPQEGEYQDSEYIPDNTEFPQDAEFLSDNSLEDIHSSGMDAFSGDLTVTPFSIAPTVTFPAQNAIVPLQALTLRWNLVSNATYILAVRNVTNNNLIIPNTPLAVGRNSFTVPVHLLTPGHQYRFALASLVGGVTSIA